MKSINIVIFFFCTIYWVFGQEANRVGDLRFNTFIYWSKENFNELYSLEANKCIGERTSVGVQLLHSESSDRDFPRSVTAMSISGGVRWNLLSSEKWFYLDPGVHLSYYKLEHDYLLQRFRGIGVLSSVELGLYRGRFKVGLMFQFQYLYGKLISPLIPEDRWEDKLRIRYGINFCYVFN